MSYHDPEPIEQPRQDNAREIIRDDDPAPLVTPDLDFDMTRPKTLKQAFTIAQYLANSGMFPDVRSTREAFGKIAVAIDLGLSPTQGLRSIHLIEGKPELGFDVIGSLMKDRGYSWTVKFDGNDSVALEFFDKAGTPLGDSTFSIEDAEQANLANKQNWKKYPRNMLFARALSNGARWYAPEVFGGAVYVRGELEDTDEPPPKLPEPDGLRERLTEKPTDQTEEQASGEALAPSDGADQPATETGAESPAEPAATTRPDGHWYCWTCTKKIIPLSPDNRNILCPVCGNKAAYIEAKDDDPGKPSAAPVEGSPTPSEAEAKTGAKPVSEAAPKPANWLEEVVSRETYVELRGMAASEELDAAGFIEDPLAETDDPDVARFRFERWLQTAKMNRKQAEKVEDAQDARSGD